MDKEIPIPSQHISSYISNMSASSAPSSVAGSLSLLVVSAPENTLTSCSPTPQLAICSELIVDNNNDSVVDYNQSVTGKDDDPVPPGYLINNPQLHHFYPIYC